MYSASELSMLSSVEVLLKCEQKCPATSEDTI